MKKFVVRLTYPVGFLLTILTHTVSAQTAPADLTYDANVVTLINDHEDALTTLTGDDTVTGSVQSTVDAEAITRMDADNILQTNIDNLSTASAIADQQLASSIITNRKDTDRNARGIAMVAVLTHTTILPGMTHALDISAAYFEEETGIALSYSRRLDDGVQVNFGAASTSDFNEGVVRAGVGYQW